MTYVIRDPHAPASDKQVSYLRSLLDKHETPADSADTLRARLELGDVTKGQANEYIEFLKLCPQKSAATTGGTPVTEPGLYEHAGLIYKVQRSKTSGNLYAKVLDTSVDQALRLTAAGTTIRASYTYAPGAFRQIDASNRITGDRANELSIIFSNCLVCGRTLTAAQSVARSIGPVCIGRV